MRLTIRGLMIALPAMAFGLLAVRGAGPSARWPVEIAAALLGLVCLHAGSARCTHAAGWAGFGWGGSVYLALCFGPGLDLREVDYLPSSIALDRLFPVIYSDRTIDELALEREFCTCLACVSGVRDALRIQLFTVGQLASATLAAVFCGLAAQGLSRCRPVRARDQAGHSA